MDERKEILQDTIDRLIETALQELDQKLLSPTSATRSDRTHSWMNSTAN